MFFEKTTVSNIAVSRDFSYTAVYNTSISKDLTYSDELN